MKACLAERNLVVREMASDTLSQIPSVELDVLLTLSLRALEGADYRTRLAVSHLLATVFSNAVRGSRLLMNGSSYSFETRHDFETVLVRKEKVSLLARVFLREI